MELNRGLAGHGDEPCPDRTNRVCLDLLSDLTYTVIECYIFENSIIPEKGKAKQMNFKDNESVQKLQGSYYTPKWIADFVARWIAGYGDNAILEPSCGDGVFFQAFSDMTDYELRILGFDTDSYAVSQCRERHLSSLIHSEVRCDNFLNWAINNYNADKPMFFDAVVGNPPFIRYQYLEKEMQQSAQDLFTAMGQKFTKHTNAWLPFVLASVEFLKPGGHIGMVIPAEVLHVLYAQGLREYLISACSRILLVDPEDIWFEDTLQGAMLIMAEKKADGQEGAELGIVRTTGKRFAEGDPYNFFENAEYLHSSFFDGKWTYALLSKNEAEALDRVRTSKIISLFRKVADVDVGIVTGANKFFLVPDETVKQYGLSDVAHPMFGRSEHCRGIIYDAEQHRQNTECGYPTNFIYFESEEKGRLHQDYLSLGEAEGIPSRYKCRIRTPWYKVPSVYASKVNMLKRSNGMPRLILNEMNAYNTDTAYRIRPMDGVNPEVFVYCFINSITALSAELEGRFYGGGVLELVPSEIERLLVVYEDGDWDINKLNEDIKVMSKSDLLKQQDEIIFSHIADVDMEDISILHEALIRLQVRRQRIDNHSPQSEE